MIAVVGVGRGRGRICRAAERVLMSMVDDILVRDTAIRHGIRNVDPLKRLAVYLLTNVAKPFSGNRLTSIAGDISTPTVLDYVDYMQDAYLIDSTSQYATNIRATVRNPKKVYAIGTGIVSSVSLSQTDDKGPLLENYQFLQLRKWTKGHIYY
ncbi:MAG: ATP-binding protein [Bacteroidales bacterium]|nr:ATP-binding protein [Bacteroidales bacterium]